MGDVLSTHLDDARRQHIAEKTGKILTEFLRYYEDQYGVALFNSMRHEIEGTGAPQAQLLSRKGFLVPAATEKGRPAEERAGDAA